MKYLSFIWAGDYEWTAGLLPDTKPDVPAPKKSAALTLAAIIIY